MLSFFTRKNLPWIYFISMAFFIALHIGLIFLNYPNNLWIPSYSKDGDLRVFSLILSFANLSAISFLDYSRLNESKNEIRSSAYVPIWILWNFQLNLINAPIELQVSTLLFSFFLISWVRIHPNCHPNWILFSSFNCGLLILIIPSFFALFILLFAGLIFRFKALLHSISLLLFGSIMPIYLYFLGHYLFLGTFPLLDFETELPFWFNQANLGQLGVLNSSIMIALGLLGLSLIFTTRSTDASFTFLTKTNWVYLFIFLISELWLFERDFWPLFVIISPLLSLISSKTLEWFNGHWFGDLITWTIFLLFLVQQYQRVT